MAKISNLTEMIVLQIMTITIIISLKFFVLSAAESCCINLGSRVSHEEILDLLIPRVKGEVPGGDTFSQSEQFFLHFVVVVSIRIVLYGILLYCIVLYCIIRAIVRFR